jgi:hypothetical protein
MPPNLLPREQEGERSADQVAKGEILRSAKEKQENEIEAEVTRLEDELAQRTANGVSKERGWCTDETKQKDRIKAAFRKPEPREHNEDGSIDKRSQQP